MSALAQEAPVSLLDLSGGQVDGEHCTQIEANQFEHYINGYAVGKKMRGRQGLKKISTAGAYAANLNSFRAYRPTGSNWSRSLGNIMVGSQVGFAYLNGTTLTAITAALPSSSKSWHMRQYKDVMYAARQETVRADSLLHRVTLTGESTAGIAAPATAMAAAQGAAGILAAGAYTYVVVYENSTSGAVSNPSPIVTVTIVASKKVDLSSIPVSANAQVDRKKIYRSLIDQTGVYYFVANITNATTTYTDNISEDALGDAASYENAEPLAGLHVLEEWNERLWAADEHNVYYSRILFPESWPAANLIPVSPDDNQFINTLCADGKGKRLLVGKSGSIHEITGVSNQNFRLDLISRNHGVAGSHCMVAAEGNVFFFSGENFYGISPGGRDPQSISTVAVRKVIDNIPAGQLENVRMSVFSPLSWMIALVAQGSSTTHRKILIYNYKTGAWSVFTFVAFGLDAPCFVSEVIAPDGSIGLYAVVEGSSYRYLYKFTDDVYTDGAGVSDGTVISVALRTRGYSADGRLVTMRRPGILGRFVRSDPDTLATYSVVLNAYVDGVDAVQETLALLAPTGASDVGSTAGTGVAMWKRANLSTLQKPATFVQLQITCTETANRVELSGIALDLRVMNRRRKVA